MVLRFIMLAGTFLLASCVAIERNNPDDPGSGNYFAEGKFESSSSVAVPSSSSVVLSSSSIAPSSSSKAVSSSSVAVPSSSSVAPSSSSKAVSSSSVAVPSSSSVAPSSSSAVVSSSSVAEPSNSSSSTQSSIIRGSVIYEGETYETVKIGNQIWMARNLNYAVSGSKCGKGSSLSDENTPTCDTYGRLYTWATAMGLPSGCNSTAFCSIGYPRRGICPSGWHIPSPADWTALENFVGRSSTAGTKLKSTSGWNSNGNGTDNYGFSALPGGYGFSNGNFYSVGDEGHWWSDTENDASTANNWGMNYNKDYVSGGLGSKPYLYSVRCLQD